jgi:hypothetical protein
MTWRRTVLVTCAVLAVLARGPAARAGNATADLGVTGFYAVGHDVVWSDDRVLIDLAVQLINDGTRPVINAAVAVERPEAPEEQIENAPEWAYAILPRVTILPGDRARTASRVLVPIDEWSRWQQAGGGPIFRVTFHDDADGTVSGTLRLSRTGEIPEQP